MLIDVIQGKPSHIVTTRKRDTPGHKTLTPVTEYLDGGIDLARFEGMQFYNPDGTVLRRSHVSAAYFTFATHSGILIPQKDMNMYFQEELRQKGEHVLIPKGVISAILVTEQPYELHRNIPRGEDYEYFKKYARRFDGICMRIRENTPVIYQPPKVKAFYPVHTPFVRR